MKYQLVLPACLLLLWTFTAFVSANEDSKKDKIEVKKSGGNKIGLICSGSENFKWDGEETGNLELEYKDENTGQYTCSDASGDKKLSIYVKFRSCDNCVELDVASIMGIAIGDLVATIVIGVAVYLIASQARISSINSPQKKSSDRQHLVPNEVTGRTSNDHYEQLRRKGQRDTYDVINKR